MCGLPITCLKFLKTVLWYRFTTDLGTESSSIAAIAPNSVFAMVCSQAPSSHQACMLFVIFTNHSSYSNVIFHHSDLLNLCELMNVSEDVR